MDFRTLLKVFAALFLLSLISYGFSVLGVPGSPIDSFWKLLALSLAVSIIAGYISPHVRGIRKDDQLIATQKREVMHDNSVHTHLENIIVTAAENGRVGSKIRVKLFNGKRAEGIITGYAGTFSAATIKLTESEV